MLLLKYNNLKIERKTMSKNGKGNGKKKKHFEDLIRLSIALKHILRATLIRFVFQDFTYYSQISCIFVGKLDKNGQYMFVMRQMSSLDMKHFSFKQS